MARKYKTEKNLKQLWTNLDLVLENWYNAMELMGDMDILEDDDLYGLYNLADRVDPSKITLMKNRLETMIEEKGGSI